MRVFASIYQFENIIVSFQDNSGTTHYMPLLEPYSQLNEVRLKFQGTACLTISQQENGNKSFFFEKIPSASTNNLLSRSVNVFLQDVRNDSLILELTDTLIYEGDTWYKLRPYMKRCVGC